ncbi:MAG: acyl-CoA/acyl-ACP dehydrogenase [Candidatus Tectomicrobia bacterium]|uniref:Acyl-CoA/acyl-ACP dehydrogenase n=1 Tax=Tectimicrobiota bacterium TaxID=2528274 RepID=A0A932ZUQ4_UNCTE|nr:acyl-CoA/acyl-ACP dehydrogenase [Candidatus Tectomicrobia bacterium]
MGRRSPPEMQRWVELADRLSREKIAPRAEAVDREGRFPSENYRDLAEAGLLALMVPEAFGGIGADSLTYVTVLSKIARGCASTGLIFNMHSAIVDFLLQIAAPGQQERYFGEVRGKGAIFSSITSEPGSSFRDKLALRTSIRRDGAGYRLSGKKHFCSLSTGATYYFTWSLLNGAKGLEDGLLNVMVPSGREGIEVLDDWDTLGMRGTASNSIHFHDVRVEPGEVIGAPGSILGKDMSIWSLGYTAVYIGIAEAAYEFCVDFVKKTTYKGMEGSLAQVPRVQSQIGEMSMLLENARRAAEKLGALRGNLGKQELTFILNQAKYLATEAAKELAEQGIRLCGGRGLSRSLPIERHLRDALAGVVMPPANDRCLETVGKIALGLEAKTLEFQ